MIVRKIQDNSLFSASSFSISLAQVVYFNLVGGSSVTFLRQFDLRYSEHVNSISREFASFPCYERNVQYPLTRLHHLHFLRPIDKP